MHGSYRTAPLELLTAVETGRNTQGLSLISKDNHSSCPPCSPYKYMQCSGISILPSPSPTFFTALTRQPSYLLSPFSVSVDLVPIPNSFLQGVCQDQAARLFLICLPQTRKGLVKSLTLDRTTSGLGEAYKGGEYALMRSILKGALLPQAQTPQEIFITHRYSQVQCLRTAWGPEGKGK